MVISQFIGITTIGTGIIKCLQSDFPIRCSDVPINTGFPLYTGIQGIKFSLRCIPIMFIFLSLPYSVFRVVISAFLKIISAVISLIFFISYTLWVMIFLSVIRMGSVKLILCSFDGFRASHRLIITENAVNCKHPIENTQYY